MHTWLDSSAVLRAPMHVHELQREEPALVLPPAAGTRRTLRSAAQQEQPATRQVAMYLLDLADHRAALDMLHCRAQNMEAVLGGPDNNV